MRRLSILAVTTFLLLFTACGSKDDMDIKDSIAPESTTSAQTDSPGTASDGNMSVSGNGLSEEYILISQRY